jgi:hypothetical protein
MHRMECKTILAIAENSGYPTDIAHDLKTKLILRKQKQQQKIVRNVQLIQYNNSSPKNKLTVIQVEYIN